MEVDSGKPYFDTEKINNEYYRTFNKEVDNYELIWHRDKENREVKVINDANGWLFQYENELPKCMKKDDILIIPSYTFHRIIKEQDCTNLELGIKEWQI